MQHSAGCGSDQRTSPRDWRFSPPYRDTPKRTRQELSLQTALGPALMVTRGVAAPEVEQTYLRIQALAHHMEETPRGLWLFYYMRGEIETAHEFGAQLMEFAQRRQDPTLLFEAHLVLGFTLFRLGEVLPARTHFEQGMVLYDPGQHHAQAFLYAADPGVMLLCYTARDLWLLGYPAQALERSQAALTLAPSGTPLQSGVCSDLDGISPTIAPRPARRPSTGAQTSSGSRPSRAFPFWWRREPSYRAGH